MKVPHDAVELGVKTLDGLLCQKTDRPVPLDERQHVVQQHVHLWRRRSFLEQRGNSKLHFSQLTFQCSDFLV